MHYLCYYVTKFHFYYLYDKQFLNYRLFWTSAWNDPKMTLNTTKTLPICVTSVPESHVEHYMYMVNHFWLERLSWDKTATNDLKPYEVKGLRKTYYMCYQCPWVPSFSVFCSITSHFWDMKLLQNGKCTEWPWTLMVKSTMCTPITSTCVLTSEVHIFCISLYSQPFSKYFIFYNWPLTSMLNIENRIWEKSQIWNLTILSPLVEISIRSIHEFWTVWNHVVYF